MPNRVPFHTGFKVAFAKAAGGPRLIVAWGRKLGGYLQWRDGQEVYLTPGEGRFTLSHTLLTPLCAKVIYVNGGSRVHFGATGLSAVPRPLTQAAAVVDKDTHMVEITLPHWAGTSGGKVKPVVTLDPPRIAYGGKACDLYRSQAILLWPLAHTFGGIFTPDVLIARGYEAAHQEPDRGVAKLLERELLNLNTRLNSIGLTIKPVKGIGYGLHAK